jgi:hypothetical protein
VNSLKIIKILLKILLENIKILLENIKIKKIIKNNKK